jgi:hypothetical protein
MANSSSVQRDERARRLLHAALREAEQRYRHEMMDEEERLVLRERILSIKRRLAATS